MKLDRLSENPIELPRVSRRPVAFIPQADTHSLASERRLPFIIEAAEKRMNFINWIENHRTDLEAGLIQHGAILFRGFRVDSVIDFERATRSIYPELLEYRERSSPRTQLGDRIYTSTDYPSDRAIFPHNEHSYAKTFPLRLFFCCITPATHGGETPIAGTRQVLASIDPAIRARFAEKKYMYVRNFGHGLGLTWETAFQTTSRAVVEEYCREAQIEFEWRDRNYLRTRQVRPVLAQHPVTNEWVWFNHLTFFHVSTLDSDVRALLEDRFEEEQLPNNTYYGDGSPIEPEIVEHLRDAYRKNLVAFPWYPGDILLLDNLLASHGRAPFSGPRKVLFAMTNPHTRQDI